MSLQLNLAALTESELLALFGPDELQRRLPEISRARLAGQALSGPPVLEGLKKEDQVTPGSEKQLWGATPEQSRALSVLDAELRALAALPGEMYHQTSDDLFVRTYTLGEMAVAVQWNEGRRVTRPASPEVYLLTWLRDRASGLACVLTTSALSQPVPAFSEEIDIHQHPETSPAELFKLHQQYVQRLGRAQKLPEGGWLALWQATHELNLAAWTRRGTLQSADNVAS